MPRFFVDPSQIIDDHIYIHGGDVNHIRNVLRMKKGDELSVSDGQGQDYFCRIEQLDPDAIRLHIDNSWASYVELPVEVTLFQGLPKADKMELIIQKSVELGAFRIVPVVTERTIVRLDEKKAEKKQKRWQQISESGAKQAGRGRIPQVGPMMTFQEALASAKRLDGCLIPYERAKGMAASRETIRGMKDCKRIGVFIGPEGGFSEKEIKEAMAAGAHPITLGRRILRTETAGLTMLSILMYEFEEDV